MQLHSALRSIALGSSSVLISLAVLGAACEPASDTDEFDPAVEDLEDEDLAPQDEDASGLVPQDAPPTNAEAAGKTRTASHDLAADDEPVAALGWLAAVSEETPPATCDGNGAAIWVDCMGGSCDDIQMFCGSHSGTVGTREWTDWFSEEGTSWEICPGTQYVTGVACKGFWCDDVSIECTDLGLTAQTCWWSSYFKSNDPLFMAPTDHLIAGMQCKGAYCEEMRFFTCEV